MQLFGSGRSAQQGAISFDVESLMRFYFWATLRAWPSGAKPRDVSVEWAPHAKEYAFRGEDDFSRYHYVDRFFTRPTDDYSAGYTHIFHDDMLVWVMHYRGQYPKRAMPVVQNAILVATAAGNFNIGRGPEVMRDGGEGGLLYRCLSYPQEPWRPDIVNFVGLEQVFDGEDASIEYQVGYHHISGGVVAPLADTPIED